MKRLYLLSLLLMPSPSFSEKAKGRGEPVSITLSTLNDEIAFDKPEIRGTARSKIRIRFVNGAQAKSEILHDIAVLKPGSLDEVLQVLQKNGYDTEKLRHHPSVIALSKALKPGEEDTLELNSLAAGTYPFVCLMPGHGDMLGMKGQIVISP